MAIKGDEYLNSILSDLDTILSRTKWKISYIKQSGNYSIVAKEKGSSGHHEITTNLTKDGLVTVLDAMARMGHMLTWQHSVSRNPESRPLYEIAREIRTDWRRPYFGAVPYLDAMGQLNSIQDMYMFDPASSIVIYFLSNAGTWKGETARRIKKELNSMLKKSE